MLQDHDSLVEEHLTYNKEFDKNSYNNIPPHIWELTKRRVFENPKHPIAILNAKIREYFEGESVGTITIPEEKFSYRDDFSPICSVESTFDKILVPKNHVSRSPKDTYYVDENTLLRPHTSSH
jgi:phenylalanyl-tRNA synthetase alpha chain